MDCPYIDSNDPRCSAILNIQHIEQAFKLCTNRYTLCPVYMQISGLLAEPIGGDETINKPELIGAEA